MVQKIFGFGLGATGIVGTLVVVGIILQVTNISSSLGGLRRCFHRYRVWTLRNSKCGKKSH